MRAKWKRSRRWVLLAAVLLTTCGLPVSCAASSLWGTGEPRPVDCAEALAYAHATLPDRAEDVHCTELRWRDTFVEAEFRLPRPEATAWLAETFPSAEVSEGGLRYHATFGPEEGKAHEVGVTLRYEGGDTALVRVVGHDS